MAADDGSISKKSACTDVTCNTISWKEKRYYKINLVWLWEPYTRAAVATAHYSHWDFLDLGGSYNIYKGQASVDMGDVVRSFSLAFHNRTYIWDAAIHPSFHSIQYAVSLE